MFATGTVCEYAVMQLVEALCYKMEGHGFLIIEGIFEIFH
jgi:hypothetical protein